MCGRTLVANAGAEDVILDSLAAAQIGERSQRTSPHPPIRSHTQTKKPEFRKAFRARGSRDERQHIGVTGRRDD